MVRHKPFKRAKECIIQLIFGKQRSCLSLFLIKMSLKTFCLLGGEEKDASSEQIFEESAWKGS